MYKVKGEITFNQEWDWDSIEFDYDSRYMAIKEKRLLQEASYNMTVCDDGEFPYPEDTSCTLHAVCYSPEGAYLDSVDIYGHYEKDKGFIKED